MQIFLKTVVQTCEITLAIHFFYQKETKSFTQIVDKSYNKTVIDFNFCRHKDLCSLKSDIHLGLTASVNITFSGGKILMST